MAGTSVAAVTGWEYVCPACGVRVSSGWADPVCPIASCREIMDLVSGPEPSREEVERVLAEMKAILRP